MMAALLALSMTFATPGTGRAQEVLYLAIQTDLTAEDGTNLAKIPPGTRLEVLNRAEGRVEVEIAGWSPEGGENYMFLGVGQRILVAHLTESGLMFAPSAGEQEDDYESLWFDMRLTGWVPEARTTPDIATIWEAGSNLFHQRCTRCHALHRPVEFTANQWPSILKIMTVRAGLTGADRALVIQYMQTHAKDGPARDDTTAEEDEGLKAIEGSQALAENGAEAYDDNGCAGCHGDDAATPAELGYPQLAGQQAEYIFKQMMDFQSGARANDEYEVMRGMVEDLSPEDIRAISYWLATLDTP